MSVLLEVTQLSEGQGWNSDPIYLNQTLACEDYHSLLSWRRPGAVAHFTGKVTEVPWGEAVCPRSRSWEMAHRSSKSVWVLSAALTASGPAQLRLRWEAQPLTGLGLGELPC